MNIYPSDYYSLDNPELDTLTDFMKNEDVARYVYEQGITLGAVIMQCKAGMKWIDGRTLPCLAYVNTVEGRVVNVKYRAVNTKKFTQLTIKDSAIPQAPYNIDCLWPERVGRQESITLIVTEGEKDCCALLSCDYTHVISVPNGAQAKPEKYMKPFRDWLRPVSRVIICHDEDEPGYQMMHSVRDFFTDECGMQVSVTRIPYMCKDIAEVLQIYGEKGVRKVIEGAVFPKSTQMVYAADRMEAIKNVLRGNYDHGYGTGFGEITDRHLKLTDAGGLIVVTGKPNSGKTDWCRCLMAHLMCHRDKGVCFCSFEEPDKDRHVASFVKLAMATSHPSDMEEHTMEEVIAFLDTHLVNMSLGSMRATPSNMIRLCEEARRRQPVHFLYIDPYLFVEPEIKSDSETMQIKHVLTKLQAWGRSRRVWVVMVAHPRKLVKDGMGQYEEIDEYTISGSAHWANLADFLLSVKRVFVAGAGQEPPGSSAPSFTVVSVMKVRDQELCHTGRLYFMRQACGRYDERPSEVSCRREIAHAAPATGDTRRIDQGYWLPVSF